MGKIIMKLLLPLAIFCIVVTDMYAQCNDTLVIFHTADSTVEVIALPCNPDSLLLYGKLDGNIGTLGNSIVLADDSADYPFSPLALAEDDYDLLAYPVRTNVAHIWADNVEQGGVCSGVLISKNIVLTAAHCIGDTSNIWHTFRFKGNGFHVSPSHAHGFPQSQFGKVKVSQIIIQKKYYDDQNFGSDFALLVLDRPIGDSIGWMGVSYYENDSVFNDSLVSYYFGYPARSGYDGKNMYYHYGLVHPGFAQGNFGTGVTGIPGQSGGGVFNIDDGKPSVYGIQLTSSPGGGCSLITKEKFWAMKNMIARFENVTSVAESPGVVSSVQIFPNPSTGLITLNHLAGHGIHSVELLNLLGQRVLLQSIQSNSETISLADLPNEVYLLRLLSSTENSTIKILKN